MSSAEALSLQVETTGFFKALSEIHSDDKIIKSAARDVLMRMALAQEPSKLRSRARGFLTKHYAGVGLTFSDDVTPHEEAASYPPVGAA